MCTKHCALRYETVLGPKMGALISQKRSASAAQGLFGNLRKLEKPGRAGNGKRVWFGALCEQLRAFAWVSQKPVRGRKGAGACTNSPSHEPDETQKALEAQRRNRKPLNIHHLFGNGLAKNFEYSLLFEIGKRKPLDIHHLFVI